MKEAFSELLNELGDLFIVYKHEIDIITSYEELFLFDLPYWNINIVDIKIEEFDKIVEIIHKIKTGYISNLFEDILYIKKYLTKRLSIFEYEHNDKRNWRNKCPELYFTIYDLEIEIMDILKQLLEFMKMSPFRLFEIMTSVERISLRNICNEKRQNCDIERYISGFIGF